MIISVGYAACHWCHVMEHESFEDSTVAALMNDKYISIKVDREERPDVDDIYMNACHLISQRSCGWPLNAIALPDGRPIFAGTYFPKAQWSDILENVAKVHTDNPAKTEEIASQVTQSIRNIELVPLNPDAVEFQVEDLNSHFDSFSGFMDYSKGGRKGSPKFPMPANYLYLLQYHS